MRRVFILLKENIFVRNSAILFAGTMVANILNYVFHLLVARMVSPEMYGEIESLISLLVIISVPAGTLELIATRQGARLRASNDFLGTYSFSKYLVRKIFLYGIPIFCITLIFTPITKRFLNIEETLPMVLIWGVMFFSFLSSATFGILTGWQKFYHTSLIGVIATFLKLVFAVIILNWGFAVNGVVGSYVLSTIFVYIANLYLLKKYFKQPISVHGEDKKFSIEAPDLKTYIFPVFLSTLSLAILGNVDMIFAKHHLESFAAGEYGALSIAAKTIFFATGVLTTVLFAMSAEEHHKKEKSSHTFRLAIWLTSLVTIVSTVIFFLFPTIIISLLFGKEYLGASEALPWFALAVSAYSFANLFLQYLLSLHDTKIIPFITILTILEIISLFFFGSSFYAIIGITIGTQVIAALLGVIFILKRRGYVQENLSSHSSL